ncbi:NAD(P)-linked oxidoreductase superfamily protein [Rhynchospora pubera]|uniref:NAD(P)-linked oxidoreductase superfamily protein n=1 Tax=Rhynchospora pubera TaxID=906938 RepID=A0AAV8G9G6_9POAL|nr:NAD(P)-linked oxidoreductase superfamily protein [Rhynchospora pubera]
MALQVIGTGLCLLRYRRDLRPRAVASSSEASTTTREEDKVKLGGSDVKVSKLGIGAWSWGDTTYWNDFQWDDRKLKAAKGAFDTSLDLGLNFIDTAEVYGAGITGAINSETLLGRFIKERQQEKGSCDVSIATKFAALPWRFGRGSVLGALKNSLSRLGLSSVDLYQLHWPGIWGNEGYIDGLGDAVEQGLVKAVGVSNYSGALTGKYTPENPPTGPRGRVYTPELLTKMQPLLNRIKEIGQNYDKTNTQVVLNWLICQGNVIPIPGAKNAEQASEFAGSLGWSLTDTEIEELRSLASEIGPIIGFPVERL